MIKSKNMRRPGLAVRLKMIRKAYIILVGEPEGSLGRPVLR
jgi:hypothetical protein